MLPDRARVLELQLRELNRFTGAVLAGTADRGSEVDAMRLAARIPALVETLGVRVHAQVAGGRWAVPERAERTPLPYAIAVLGDPTRRPQFLQELDRARHAARSIADVVGDRMTPMRFPCPAQHVLAPALANRDTVRRRSTPPLLAQQTSARPERNSIDDPGACPRDLLVSLLRTCPTHVDRQV